LNAFLVLGMAVIIQENVSDIAIAVANLGFSTSLSDLANPLDESVRQIDQSPRDHFRKESLQAGMME